MDTIEEKTGEPYMNVDRAIKTKKAHDDTDGFNPITY